MPTIQITGYADKDLILQEVGKPPSPRTEARAGEVVNWVVLGNSGVKHIHKIAMKSDPGSTDVFSSAPPNQNGDKKHWKATVNGDAQTGSEFIYEIQWVKDGSPDTDIIIFDPIISIKPSTTSS